MEQKADSDRKKQFFCNVIELEKNYIELKNDNKIENLEITPNFNEVPIKDTLNEVWHIIFGLINEELIKQKVVACPIYIKGQGRFLKCIYIEK